VTPLVNLLKTTLELRKSLRVASLGSVVVLMLLPGAAAQTTKGSIVGHVTDPSGAVLVGASVELRNENTGATDTAKTDRTGEYTFSAVDPGTYSLSVTGKGFEQSTASGIVLDVAGTMRQDMKMSVGSATEAVSITSASPVITTDSPEISSIIDNKQIEETPINGRDTIFGLMALAPGVQAPGTNPLIAGSGFQGGTSATVDGISINDLFNARIVGPIISFDGIAEMTVIGSAAPARFGRSGSQVLIVSKGGSNQFHGTLFEFNRNKDLAAEGYFAVKPFPNFNRNEFGGSIGGPIWRNKLLFFFSIEDLRRVQSTPVENTEPSPEMLTGDLSLVNAAGGLNIPQIWDPALNAYLVATTKPGPGQISSPGSNGLCCQIPAASIAPLSQYFNGFFPKLNGGVNGTCLYPVSSAGTPCAPALQGATAVTDYIYNDPTYERNFRWSLRGDYQLSTRDHLMLRYYEVNDGPYFENDLGNATQNFGNFGKTGSLVRNYAFNYTRTLTPNMVNEFAGGYDKQYGWRGSQNPNIDPGNLIPGVPHPPTGYGALPTISIYGLGGIADYNSGFNISQHDYQYDDNLTFVHGRHSMAAGAEYMRQRSGQGDTYDGDFYFNGCIAAQSCNGGSVGQSENTNVVDAFADYLMGNMFMSETQNTDFGFDATTSTYGIYFQDNWLATPSLTLNLGLRYEKMFPFGRTVGGLANFYPNLNNGAGAEVYISGQANPNLLAAYPAPAIVMGNSAGINYHNYMKTQDLNFGPHVGFALRLNDKGNLVLRGGYALIYDYFGPLINSIGEGPPFVQKTTYQAPSGACTVVAPATTCNNTPSLTWSNPFLGSTTTGGPTQVALIREPKRPYHDQVNLTMEWEFLRNTAIRVSYVGNFATHLVTPVPLNNPALGPLPAGTTSAQVYRPYQPWGAITYYETNTSSNLNQMQAAVRRRFSDLTLSLDVQWTRALGVDAYNDGGITIPTDTRHDYGNLDVYARRYMIFHHIYQLPVGTGKRLFGRAGKVTNDFIGGWRVSGVLTLRDGFPMSVSFSPIGTLGNYPTGRPNVVPGQPQINKGVVPSKVSMINVSAFCTPGVCPWDGAVMNATTGAWGCPAGSTTCPNPVDEFTYGNEERNTMTGPGYANYDSSVQKDTRLNEKALLQLRVDAFNTLNRTNFAIPTNREINAGSTPFGVSTAIQGNAREVQLGAKIIF